MFVRAKRTGQRTYLQLVESYRDGDRVRQRLRASLGRLDLLQQSGGLEDLARSLTRFSDRLAILSASGREVREVAARRIGAPLLFARLWRELGVAEVLHGLAAERNFGFDLERAVFVTVLHRLLAPGSDRQAERWMRDYLLPGAEGLDLQHFYRAMAWLGEPLGASEQAGATPFAPRCTKDVLEEQLFARRRDLFTGLDLLFFDTTSIYFEGQGGESLGQYGHSKDHRPDLRQLVVGVVLDNESQPVCAELWPGNSADVKTLLPVAARLRARFGVPRPCVVADRGMISAQTRQELEKESWSYILGARMRSCAEVRDEVLGRAGRYEVVRPEREASHEPSPLKVKEVWVAERRYVVCLNEEEARKDRHDREAIVTSLREALRHGDKSLVGNRGYRRYLKAGAGRFTIDDEKIEAEARYDGKWVLQTNTALPAAEVALKYKQLWMVEEVFRAMKTVLETRPIYHKCDETIRGHVWCSFLALVLRVELRRRLAALKGSGARPEWADVVRDLEALKETEIEVDGKLFVVRSEARGAAVKVFRACGVALPALGRAL